MGHSIEEPLAAHKSQILERWLEQVLMQCGQATRLPRQAPDPFCNPVIWIAREALHDAYDQVCLADEPSFGPTLERLMRLLALERADAADAVASLSALKTLIRQELSEAAAAAELANVDTRIDELARLAHEQFDASRRLLEELPARQERHTVAQRRQQRQAAQLEGKH